MSFNDLLTLNRGLLSSSSSRRVGMVMCDPFSPINNTSPSSPSVFDLSERINASDWVLAALMICSYFDASLKSLVY